MGKSTELAESGNMIKTESVSEAMKVFELDVDVKVKTEVNFK